MENGRLRENAALLTREQGTGPVRLANFGQKVNVQTLDVGNGSMTMSSFLKSREQQRNQAEARSLEGHKGSQSNNEGGGRTQRVDYGDNSDGYAQRYRKKLCFISLLQLLYSSSPTFPNFLNNFSGEATRNLFLLRFNLR